MHGPLSKMAVRLGAVVATHSFDRQTRVTGVLEGIKGQYLMFDSGVINLRKFTGYAVTLTC